MVEQTPSFPVKYYSLSEGERSRTIDPAKNISSVLKIEVSAYQLYTFGEVGLSHSW